MQLWQCTISLYKYFWFHNQIDLQQHFQMKITNWSSVKMFELECVKNRIWTFISLENYDEFITEKLWMSINWENIRKKKHKEKVNILFTRRIGRNKCSHLYITTH